MDLRSLLVAAGTLAGSVFAYARWIEPSWLDVHAVEIPIQGLDPAFDGYRISFISDIHWGPQRSERWLRRIVARTNAIGADVIAIGGDFIQMRSPNIRDGLAILGELSARDGVWAVLGNHDYDRRGGSPWQLRRELAGTPIVELWNESVAVTRGESRLWIGGVGDLWRDACDVSGAFRGVPPTEPRILISHNPDSVLQRHGVRIDLMLSGHTHGGQVRIPLVGSVVTKTRTGRDLDMGMNRWGGTIVYTSRGIGYGRWKLRFLSRPEIPVIVLRSATA